MLGELKNASDNLHSALRRYLTACSNIRSCASQGGLLNASREIHDQIQQELDRFDQHESQLQDAKIAIKFARNSAQSITPINALPAEILVYIFHLALGSQPCAADYLAQVCSHWRSVSLGIPSLWSRIQYHPGKDAMLQPRLLDRVRIYLGRAGQLPLHISLTFIDFSDEWYEEKTKSLFKSIAGRMQTLELDVKLRIRQAISDTQSDFLGALLLNSNQAVFSKLVTRHPNYNGHITPYHSRAAPPLRLRLLTGQLDSAFASIRVLQLKGLFPTWASTAYYDLVDLRLAPSNIKFAITELDLMSILGESLRLRILHFGLDFIDNQTTSPVDSMLRTPVYLGDLEELRVFGGIYDPTHIHTKVEHLLSLLVPGTKPLRLFLDDQSALATSSGPISMKQTRTFFEQSHVAELYAEGHPLPTGLLSLLAAKHLKSLVLADCRIYDGVTLLEDQDRRGIQYPGSLIDTLYIVRCSMSLAELQSELRNSQVQRMILHGNIFYLRGELAPMEKVYADLSTVCGTVIFAAEPPAFVSRWLEGGLYGSN